MNLTKFEADRIFMFGSSGAGKTTYAKTLLSHRPNRSILLCVPRTGGNNA